MCNWRKEDMRKKLLVKTVAFSIIVLFTGTGVTSSINVNPIKSMNYGNFLYVGGGGPGNYSKIQDAVDNATDGDTVFVYNGIYYEHITIAKDINLFGEGNENTIIDGQGVNTTVEICGNINLSGFAIQNAEVGISNFILPPPNNIYEFFIYENVIKNNTEGLSLRDPLKSVIYNNTITNNKLGITFFIADDYEVKNNNFINNEKQAYFENVLFYQFMPKIKWNGNYWDDWNIRLPRVIRGEIVILFVLRPGWLYKTPICPRFNVDWHPAKEPYDFSIIGMVKVGEYEI
jgi:parallel beta-helix repeat protein